MTDNTTVPQPPADDRSPSPTDSSTSHGTSDLERPVSFIASKTTEWIVVALLLGGVGYAAIMSHESNSKIVHLEASLTDAKQDMTNVKQLLFVMGSQLKLDNDQMKILISHAFSDDPLDADRQSLVAAMQSQMDAVYDGNGKTGDALIDWACGTDGTFQDLRPKNDSEDHLYPQWNPQGNPIDYHNQLNKLANGPVSPDRPKIPDGEIQG